MIEVAFSTSFLKAYKKRISKNSDLVALFKSKLEIFIQNPYSTELRTHKLSGKMELLMSFSIKYDLRILFYFAEPRKAVFIDIGTHDEVY